MYTAPIEDMRFVLNKVVGLDAVAALPGYEEASAELVDAVLEEAGRLASEVLDPLNRSGDLEGARLENGVVYTAKGFKEAYRTFVEGGWNSVPFDPDYGGQGLPWTVQTPLMEIWAAANLSFSLCPLLNQGAVEAIASHGSDAQKATYLPKMVSGEWTGTMNLTEPQAGSDLGRLRTRAVPEGDHYRITGQKIFITFGEHDLTDNIIHLVLARTPDAPPGSKGISLFIVPKFLVREDGGLDGRNDLRCVSLEHKLGINASPTAVMAYGDNEGAVGYLVGEENHGLAYMFTMMNNARLGVGVQGLALSERAYQQARSYAAERIQGRPVDGSAPEAVAIIRHPDVRRMLLHMKATTEAIRALDYLAAAAFDASRRHPDEEERRRNDALVGLLTPLCKGWGTDMAVEMASTGLQVHGGMGFIEETGAAQIYRDVRITPIYEGTNGIQANDLVFRKVGRDGGATARAFIAEMRALDPALAGAPGGDLAAIRRRLADGLETLERATDWILETLPRDVNAAAAAAVDYLRLFGTVAGGWMMARSALAAARDREEGGDARFAAAKIATARFYADYVMPEAETAGRRMGRIGETVMAFADDAF